MCKTTPSDSNIFASFADSACARVEVSTAADTTSGGMCHTCAGNTETERFESKIKSSHPAGRKKTTTLQTLRVLPCLGCITYRVNTSTISIGSSLIIAGDCP